MPPIAITNSRPYVEIPSPSRRRVTENDGEFALGIIESIKKITRGLSRNRGDESKSERDFAATHSSHTGSTWRGRTWQKLRARKNQAAELLRQNAELERIPLDIYNREGVEI